MCRRTIARETAIAAYVLDAIIDLAWKKSVGKVKERKEKKKTFSIELIYLAALSLTSDKVYSI